MYTGFRLIGIIGMFLGPILLIIIKNVFKDFIDGGVMKMIFEPTKPTEPTGSRKFDST